MSGTVGSITERAFRVSTSVSRFGGATEPEHRFTPEQRTRHSAAIGATVDALTHELRTNGEVFTS